MPSSKILFNLFGKSAQLAYTTIKADETTFYWVKVQILEYESLNDIQKLYIGKHTVTMHCFLADVKYLEFLKIPFEIKQILACKGFLNTKLQTFCKQLIKEKSTSKASKSILKTIALYGLG